ncbi:hypothetical protein J2S03_003496, partial [Alicyclobacillus cycloheptanicus]|nr:hypothetical protein [Alicyclobacillus cycloheptanicus]MDQ0191458.1 hypothetical protein [Alicyclobacillus cycloheptanicus]MDQ0191623.1 hypothetical protein [Alicyclobacillus cycloheptanicus]
YGESDIIRPLSQMQNATNERENER